MAYDEGLATRIEEQVAGVRGLKSKKMFGGVGCLLGGNMAVGIWHAALQRLFQAQKHFAGAPRRGR